MTEVVDRAFRPEHPASYDQNNADDQEYRRLRALGRKEAEARGQCFDGARKAYEEGDGALAHQLSEKGKLHDRQCKTYNQQAADFVFRANNSRSAADEIDLHGLYVEEAIEVFEIRVKACQQRHEDHLHVIVGKGIHSLNHIQKLRPAIEKLCQERQFKYYVEENEGRILVKFGEGAGQLSQGEAHSFWDKIQSFANPQYAEGSQSQSYHQPQQSYQHQQQYQGGQQNHYNRPNQGNQNNDITEQIVKKAAPIIFRKLRQCCTIM